MDCGKILVLTGMSFPKNKNEFGLLPCATLSTDCPPIEQQYKTVETVSNDIRLFRPTVETVG